MPKISDDNLLQPESTSSTQPEVSRRSIREYIHIPSGGNRFFRAFSSREKLIDGTKTLAWVVPLTLLIWIYAVREQVVQPTGPNLSGVPVTIQCDSDRYLEYIGTDQPTVSLQLTGPQQAFELVKEELATHIPHGLKIDIGSSLGIGNKQPVNIVDRIQNMDIFKNSGVTVQDSQPRVIYVNVYKMGQREVPVSVPSEITNLSLESRFEPAKVSVSGPEPILQQIDQGLLQVQARLAGYQQLKQPGSHSIPGVQLEFSTPQPRLRIEPVQVTAAVIVQASDVTFEIPGAIPIRISALETTLNRYDVSLTNGDSISNIHVIGPTDKIDSIKDKSFIVRAALPIESTDAGKTVSRALEYTLPEGVRITKEDAARTVEFKVTRRE